MGKLNLEDLAASIVGCFPTLDLLEQRLSLELYRLLAAGQPVPEELQVRIAGTRADYERWLEVRYAAARGHEFVGDVAGTAGCRRIAVARRTGRRDLFAGQVFFSIAATAEQFTH